MLSERLRQEIPLVGMSLFVAFVIWLTAEQSQLETDQVVVPVRMENVPSNVKIEVTPRQVAVRLRYPVYEHGRVTPQNFVITLDAAKMFGPDPREWAGVEEPIVREHNLTLDEVKQTGLPGTVRVAQFVNQGRLRLECSLLTHRARVKVKSQGELPPQYALSREIRAEPAEVLLTAPFEELDRMTKAGGEISTKAIDLSGRTEDFSAYTSLDLPTGVQLVGDSEVRIQVFAGIGEKEFEKVLSGVPIHLFVLDETLEAEVEPAVAEVKVKVRFSAIERLDAQLFAFSLKEAIPEEAGRHGRAELEIKLKNEIPAELRDKIRIESFSPTAVNLEYRKRGTPAPDQP